MESVKEFNTEIDRSKGDVVAPETLTLDNIQRDIKYNIYFYSNESIT